MLGFIDLQDNSWKNHEEFQQTINNVIDYLRNSYDSDNTHFNYYKIHLLKSEQDLSNSDQTDSNSD